MTTNFDIIVIGSGLGGLVAAAKLARSGKKVMVIEQHNIPGGAATSFKREEYKFEVSLHAMDGLKDGDSKYKIFEDLGINKSINLIPEEDLYHHIDKKNSFTFWSEFDKAKYDLSNKFPNEKAHIEKYFETIFSIGDGISKIGKLNPFLRIILVPLFPFLYPNVVKNMKKTIGEHIDKYIDNEELKVILLSNLMYYHDDPYKLSLIFYAIAQTSYYKKGAWYIKGGSQKLSEALSDIIRAHGGEILLSHRVEEILSDGKKVTGIHCKQISEREGSLLTFHAPVIIANAAIPSVVKMIDGKLAERLRKKILNLQPSNSLLNVFLGLKAPTSSIGNAFYSLHVFDNDDLTIKTLNSSFHKDFDERPFIFVDYGNIDSGIVPEGKSQAVICTMDYIDEWNNLSREEYRQRKEHVARTLIERLEKHLPGIQDLIDYVEVGTSKTMERYLGTPGGAVYGYAQSPEQAILKRIKQKSPVPGLYFASAWTFPGGGFSGTILAGYLCALSVLKT